MRRAGKLGQLRRERRGGRYSEKHLTLTIPDGAIVGEGSVGWRVWVLFEAWRKFSLRFRRWLRETGKEANWYRGFEWTAGADGQGHPHFHIWIFTSYLPVGLLHWWWAQSLTECGVLVFGDEHADYFGPGGRARRKKRPTGPLPGERGQAAQDRRGAFVLLDVREVTVRRSPVKFEIIKGGKAVQITQPRIKVTAGDALVGYIAGWFVSDRDDAGNFVSAKVCAELYEALEGRKQVRASDGFLALGERDCACPTCHAVGLLVAHVTPWHALDLDARRRAMGLEPIRGPDGTGRAYVDARDRRRQLQLAGVA